MAQASQVRTYDPAASVVFLKTKERFGGLSNMAPGFPLKVNDIRIRTSEALYQACRFPHLPDVQRRIIDERSPMTAKMRSKPFRKDSRPDWDAVRVKIMRWCLRVKLAQNWREFGRLLLATGDRPIVEQSRKDDFWGAKVADDGTLIGMNVLGRLLMELREQLKGDEAESLRFIEPLPIPEFLLFGEPIEAVQAAPSADIPGWTPRRPSGTIVAPPPPTDSQPSLFEQPMIADERTAKQHEPRIPTEAASEPGRYPAYREARVHWLGEIPAYWPEKRGKYFFREIDERSQTGEEELLSVSHTTGVTPRSQKNVTMFKAESYIGHKVARPNDVVINTMCAWMSALGVSKDVGIVSPAYGVYRPLNDDDFLPAYVDYLLRTPMLRWEYICRSTGIRSSRLRLYPDEFLDIAFPCPPREEQERIVGFLRAKDVQVRRLIRNKRRLIGLLNEQKQAIINRAVTRGLKPDAPMKPTGIDWMPEIPEHWELKPLKQVAEVLFSNVDKHSHDGEADVLLCNYTDVYKNDFIKADMPFMAATATSAEIARFRLEVGDVMITKDSESWNDIGVPAIVSEELEGVLCGYHLALLRANRENLVPIFLFRALTASAVAQQLHIEATGVTRYGLSKLAIKNLLIPLPTTDEQADIVTAIRDELEPLNTSISRVDQEIHFVREYRERLIADVVTGKLDVRHVEIAAPTDEAEVEEVEELEADEERVDDEMMEGADADD